MSIYSKRPKVFEQPEILVHTINGSSNILTVVDTALNALNIFISLKLKRYCDIKPGSLNIHEVSQQRIMV